MISDNAAGFPAHTATNLIYRLREATRMLCDEGLPQVFDRHQRHAEATRRAVRAWGLEILAVNPAADSATLTAVLAPGASDADRLRQVILDRFDMSLGTGLGQLKGKYSASVISATSTTSCSLAHWAASRWSLA